jgi:hypothetical protein
MASNSEKTLDFQPVDYEGSHELPLEPEDEWDNCTIAKVVAKATSKDKYPMLVLEVALGKPDNEDNANWEGAKLTEFLTFFPKTHKAYRMGNIRMHQIASALGLEIDIFPTKIVDKSDFDECIEALTGADPFTAWTVQGRRSDTNEMSTNIRWSKPGSSATVPAADEDDDAPPAKTAAKKPAAGTKKAPAKNKRAN